MNLIVPKNPISPGSSPIKIIPKSSYSTMESILLIVVGVLLYFFIIVPKQNELKTQLDTNKQLVAQKEKIDKDSKDLRQMLDQLKKNKDKVANLDEALPLDGRPTKVYMLLGDIAEKSGMAVTSIGVPDSGSRVVAGNPDLVKNKFAGNRTVNKVEITMSLSGTFEQFLAVLKRLETSGRLFDVSTIEISASEDNKIDFVIGMATYFYE